MRHVLNRRCFLLLKNAPKNKNFNLLSTLKEKKTNYDFKTENSRILKKYQIRVFSEQLAYNCPQMSSDTLKCPSKAKKTEIEPLPYVSQRPVSVRRKPFVARPDTYGGHFWHFYEI